GVKWDGLGRRLRLNGAIFKTDYTDLQVSVSSCPTCVGTAIQNAGDADIEGGELELQAALTSQLRLSLAVGHLDGEYRQLAPAVIFSPENRLPATPSWQYSAALTHRW